MLGCTGDRATGKQRAQNLCKAQVIAQFGLDGRGHLPDAAIRVDREQRGHRDRARRRDTPDIVAQQVDDHQVLGAILWIGCECLAHLRVESGIGHTGGRPLHRLRVQRARFVAQKKFGRA